MKRRKKPCALLAVLAIACVAAMPVAAGAAPLRVALGETKAPYVMAEEKRGVEYDLIVSLLMSAGYQPEVLFLPNKRAQLMLGKEKIDAAISTSGRFVSEPYIAYRNMAITLCSRGIRLHAVGDLAGLRVGAFQNASIFLGEEFGAMAAANPEYREWSPQIMINRQLYGGRIDAAISDVNIFSYLNGQLGAQYDLTQRLCSYAIFPPTFYRLSFREAQPRDRFNLALKQALQGNLYETVAKRYGLYQEGATPYFKPQPVNKGN